MAGLQKIVAAIPSYALALGLFISDLSFLLFLLYQPSSVSPAPHPGRIGLVRFVEVPNLTEEDLKHMVPAGADIFLERKIVHLSYLAVAYIESRSKYECGKYIPATKSAFFDEYGKEVFYDPKDVKVVIAEPGSLGWAPGVGKEKGGTALTDAWFDCAGKLQPKGNTNTPCRAKHLDSLVPGYVHTVDGICVITFDGKYFSLSEFEYLKHTSLGATIHQAVTKGWMRRDHPPE